MPESMMRSSDGEEGVSPDLLAIRAVLRSLPAVHCAPGFEYRLERKLAAENGMGVRSAGSSRNWTLGWAGAGLGFATALAIAFFAFDLNFKAPSGVAGGTQIAGARSGGMAAPVVGVQVVSESANDQQVYGPQVPLADKQLSPARKDTTKPPVSKVDLNQDYFHVAGTNPNK